MQVRQALALAREQGVARLDAQLLLAHLLQRERAWLIAHDDAELDEPLVARFGADLQRRAAGVPLAYLTGEREFHGLVLHVDEAVLVPRPETEHLVDWALEILRERHRHRAADTLADLGTGSGAVALAIKKMAPWVEATATDDSAAALEVARGNAARLGLPLHLAAGSWWQAVAGKRFDIAVSNPPYVAQADPHLAALRHEPLSALAAGSDGLAAIRRIVAGAPLHLQPGGWLLLEHGHDQAEAVIGLLHRAGFDRCSWRRDLAGHPRCSAGQLPPNIGASR